MTNLNIKTGQELTFDELCNELGLEAGNLEGMKSDILKGEQSNIDNYDGEEGMNVYFDIVEGNENMNLYQFIIKITDFEQL